MARDLQSVREFVDRLCEVCGNEFRLQNNRVIVEIPEMQRKQKILLGRKKNLLVMSSVVIKLDPEKEALQPLVCQIWRKNALLSLVSLSIDSRHRVVGKISVLYDSVTEENLAFYLRSLAREGDRFEYVLSLEDQN